ncbi:PTS system mannose/fructose/N-acetylgalactosamine-transporter subunit IIB [bacterium]
MSIVLFRIDDRLIHGQVVEGWLNQLQAQGVLVVNNIVAKDEMQKTLIAMAIPPSVEVFIETVEEALKRWKQGEFDNKRLLILVSCPKDAFLLIDNGINVPSVNVGGMHYSEGKMQIFEYISVSHEDVNYFYLLAYMGIKIEGRTLPDTEKLDITRELKKI